MKSFHSILLVSLLLALCSCIEQPDQPEEQKSLPVTISPTLTKVTETNFDNGDAIGLSIISSTESYANNQKLTFNGSVFTGSLYWYSDQSQASTLKAYYPYSAGGATTFSVQTNQSGGLSSSDFVSAVQQNVYPSENSVPMIFKHQLTRLNIKVVNNSGNAYSNLKIENAVPRAIISASYTASGDMSASPVSIVPYKAAEDHYYAIIPPQTSALAVSFVQNGQVVENNIPQVEYLPGREHEMTVTIDKDKVHVTVTGTIEGWASIDEPVVYTRRLVRKVYMSHDDFTSADFKYNSSGRLIEVRFDGGEMDSSVLKVNYGSDQVLLYYYEYGSNSGYLYTINYSNGRIDSFGEGDVSQKWGFLYDDYGRIISMYYWYEPENAEKWQWFGNDLISMEDMHVSHSNYLDLDYVSSWCITGYSHDLFLSLSIITEGAFVPASEHLPEATDNGNIQYTILPDGHVREVRFYKKGEAEPYNAAKYYYMDEPESDDVGYETVPEAVDLGLSVKWASCNLGASKPEDYGDYYAWGETEPNEDYSWETYKWCNGSENTLTKYNTDSSYGKVDNKTVLDPADDVAHVKLGGKWRMPTVSELDELITTKTHASYKWEWKSLNSHNGWLVTYLINNNSIFLPAAGRYPSSVGAEGDYWSSSLYASVPYRAFDFFFDSNRVTSRYNLSPRFSSHLVRPVSD